MKQKYETLATSTMKLVKLLLNKKTNRFLLMFFLSVLFNFALLEANEQLSNTKTKVCPTCNELYQDNEKFCGKDGTKLIDTAAAKLVCPVCKKEGAENEKYCVEHGQKLIPVHKLSVTEVPTDLTEDILLAKKYYQEGNNHCDSESYDLALKSYMKAEELYSDFPELHYNLGWLYSKLGNVDLAIDHLQKYIILAPGNKDITEVQSYIVLLKQASQEKNEIIEKYKERDEVMKNALEIQNEKFDSVLVPAGKFTMGTNDGRDVCQPEHTVYLDAFEIDCYEVTNAQYWEFVKYIEETNDHSKCFEGEPSGKDHKPRYWEEEYYNVPDYPVARIDWYDAYAYAAWKGKRLPTEAEWEKAARGLDGRAFPWGNEWDHTRCNLTGEPKPAGSIESGKSIYGCYDMSGSVFEWCSDWFSRTYYQHSPSMNPKGPEKGIRKVIRGGSRFSRPFQVRITERKSERPDLFNMAIGFRCVKDIADKEEN
ncbi:MAG: SUMF1/EgtB/PvdO family nonheme iron enzyme [Candidatus Kuenenia sp.]|nr:SUMF1/EgtB/PvdO family nonheme iron enzyme [Candidatus Kuenenia hertensis]